MAYVTVGVYYIPDDTRAILLQPRCGHEISKHPATNKQKRLVTAFAVRAQI